MTPPVEHLPLRNLRLLLSGVSGFFHFCPISHESFKATVREWVTHQLSEGFGRHGGRVGTQLNALQNMCWVANGGRQHLRIQVLVVPRGHDFSDEFHAVVSGVVDSPNEG